MTTEKLEVETDSKTEQVTGKVAQPENPTAEITAPKDIKDELKLPETIEDFKKALQSASSKKMDEFLKKYGAAKLSDVEEKLAKISELENQITSSKDIETKLKSYEDKVNELQKIIDEQTPIITQKKQADFLKENNINPEFAEDFFAIYEKKLNADKSNSAEVIKSVLEKHPNMGAFNLNNVKTATKNPEKENNGDGLNKLRKQLGLPIKN